MVFSIGIISAKSSLAHIQSSLSSRKSFRTAPWTRFRKFTKSTSTNAMALCSAGRAIPHQRRASAGGQPQSAEHARHPERSFALPEHHAPHGQPHSQPVNRAGGRCGCGHRTEQFGRPISTYRLELQKLLAPET